MSRPTLAQEEASKLIEKSIPLPTDYKDYIPNAKSDQITLQQNITIISLILEIIKKIEIIVPRLELISERVRLLSEQQKEKNKETSKNKEVEELIDQLKKVEITPQKEKVKITRKAQKWTFFQLDQETKEDRKGKKDQE